MADIEPKIIGASQKGQDAFINHIFNIVGTTNKFYVEFGGYNGYVSCNTLFLRENRGWNGALIDDIYQDKNINLHKRFLTKDNIYQTFTELAVPKDLDFLCIDVDGNDYWFLQSLLQQGYNPRVIMIEANVRFNPDVDIIRKYDENWHWDSREWYGASPLAIKKLVNLYDYTVVHVHLDDMFIIKNTDLNQEDIDKDWLNIYKEPNFEIYKSHDKDKPRGIDETKWIRTND